MKKTANQILNNYLEALKMSDSSPIDLQKVILDILKYIARQETIKMKTIKDLQDCPSYIFNDFWKTIMDKATGDGHNTFILLAELRKILEEFKIIADEKDGM